MLCPLWWAHLACHVNCKFLQPDGKTFGLSFNSQWTIENLIARGSATNERKTQEVEDSYLRDSHDIMASFNLLHHQRPWWCCEDNLPCKWKKHSKYYPWEKTWSINMHNSKEEVKTLATTTLHCIFQRSNIALSLEWKSSRCIPVGNHLK